MNASGLERSVGARLRALRERKGLSLADVVRATGFSKSAVARLERGMQGARLSQMAALADAVGADLAQVVARCQRGAKR